MGVERGTLYVNPKTKVKIKQKGFNHQLVVMDCILSLMFILHLCDNCMAILYSFTNQWIKQVKFYFELRLKLQTF